MPEVGQASLPASPPKADKPVFSRRRLPHWQLAGSTYFVTWRVHPSQTELAPVERDLVTAAIRHNEGRQGKLLAFVVMNDHVHLLLTPDPNLALSKILHSLKSFTARQLQVQIGRQGKLWQEESFDRAVRSELELREKGEYVLGNPFARWPELSAYPWVGLGAGQLCPPAADRQAGTPALLWEAACLSKI